MNVHPFQDVGILRLFQGFENARGRREDRRDDDLRMARLLQRNIDLFGPLDHLAEGHVRAAHEAELRRGVQVLPDAGVAVLHTTDLGIVDDVYRRAFADQLFAEIDGLGRQMLDMVQAHRAVGGRGRAEVLKIGADRVVELRAQEAVQALDIGDLFQHLHADGRAEKLGVGEGIRFQLHHPVGLSAVVRQKAELRDAARDGAEHLDHAGVPVAACAEHGVGIYHGGALGPAQNVAALGRVAHLREIAGAGIGVVRQDAEALHLLFVSLLLAVHDVKDDLLQKIRRDVFDVDGSGVRGEGLTADLSVGQDLVIQLVNRFHDAEPEADDRMPVFTRHRNHALRIKSLAVGDQRLHHAGHRFAAGTVQDGLLFLCQLQVPHSFF